MPQGLSPEQQIALGVYQAVVVALTLWVGVSRYVLDQYFESGDAIEIDDLSVVAAGFLVLGYVLIELSAALTINSQLGEIFRALNGFVAFLATMIMLVFLEESEAFEADLKDLLKVLIVALVVVVFMLISGSVSNIF